jgi:hypothetical protein
MNRRHFRQAPEQPGGTYLVSCPVDADLVAGLGIEEAKTVNYHN